MGVNRGPITNLCPKASYMVNPAIPKISNYYYKKNRPAGALPGEVKKTARRSSLWVTWRTSPVTFTSLPATGATLRKSRILQQIGWWDSEEKRYLCGLQSKKKFTVHAATQNVNVMWTFFLSLSHHLISQEPTVHSDWFLSMTAPYWQSPCGIIQLAVFIYTIKSL